MGYKDMVLYQDMTPTLLFAAVFSSLGAFTFGYDNNWWGGVIGSTYFNTQFGSGTKLDAKGNTVHTLSASDTSTGTALGTVGIMLGCMIAPFINERFGRKASFLTLAVVGLIGSIVQICCTFNHNYWVLVGGKIIVNMSVGMASAVTGVYQSECAPPRIRGALTNAYTVFNNLGTLLANVVMYIVNARTNSSVWLVPIAVQFIFPCIILVSAPFLPESPRWLASKDRHDDALRSLRRLRGASVAEEDLAVQLREITASIEHEKTIQSQLGWLQLFRGQDRRRTLVGMGMLCLQQGQGISFTNNYLNITMLNLGFTNTYQLLVALYTGKWFITLFGFYLPDRIGRRPMVIFGAASMGTCMYIIAAVAAATNNKPTGALGNLTLASIFIWVLTFSPTWGALPWTIASEISSQQLRAKTLATAAWGGYGVGLISNLVVPYIQGAAYGNLQGKIGFIFGSFSVISIIFCVLFVPELKGRSLEELDLLYEAGVPARKFATYDVAQLKRTPVAAEGDKAGSIFEEDTRGKKEILEA